MISVIVPVYNAAADSGTLLRECLDSILSQTDVDFELLAVDDGSTDASADVLTEYAAQYPAVRLFRKENGGVSSARNLGVLEARGEYVCFVDADDHMLPGALSLLYRIRNQTGAPVVIGRAADNQAERPSADARVKEYSGEEFSRRTLYQQGGHNSPWAMLVDRDLLLEEPFEEGMRYEDLELSVRLYMRASRVAVVDTPVYFYRVHSGSFLGSWSDSRTDSLKATAMIESYAERNCQRLLPAASDRRLSANFNVLILASLNGVSGSMTDGCWQLIKKYRRASLFNPRVRIKNKIGIILSYFGRKAVVLAGRLIMK